MARPSIIRSVGGTSGLHRVFHIWVAVWEMTEEFWTLLRKSGIKVQAPAKRNSVCHWEQNFIHWGRCHRRMSWDNSHQKIKCLFNYPLPKCQGPYVVTWSFWIRQVRLSISVLTTERRIVCQISTFIYLSPGPYLSTKQAHLQTGCTCSFVSYTVQSFNTFQHTTLYHHCITFHQIWGIWTIHIF